MLSRIVLASLFGLLPALASPVERWTESQANCRQFYAPVYAENNNSVISAVIGGPPANQQAWTQQIVDMATAGSPLAAALAAAPKQLVQGNYTLAFEYCEPKNGQPKGVFQTIHGLIGARGYWNAQIGGKTDNSFAESAAAAGWATLSYDRLGVGNSDHPDGLDIVQGGYEVAQAVTISNMLRTGSLGSIPAFQTIWGMGHSFGSIQLFLTTLTAPDIFDGLVLTGYSGSFNLVGSLNLGGVPVTLANYAYPDRFGYLGNDYMTLEDQTADQKFFFHYPNYTQNALDVFTQTKGEAALGEMYAQSIPTPGDMPYTKPLLVVTGDNDAPACSGNCSHVESGSGKSQLETARAQFPGVADEDFAIFQPKNTGHAINFHANAYQVYQDILGWVGNHTAA